MGQIQILPPDVVNRIAAGEVIERPASVVKELVENAIDAGASEVHIEVEDGGRRRVRVRDNGSGMPPEDLPLAFRSHATSKLLPSPQGGASRLELFDIGTLGFRGEALASIASISEVEAVSRTSGAECAHRYRLSGSAAAGESGRGDGPEPVAGPAGTSIEVRNLFWNTPARRKFLRAGPTELSHIVDQVVRLALGFRGIRFSLLSDGKRVLDCPPVTRLRERLAAVIGPERARELLEVREEPEGGLGGVRIEGFVGPPHLHRQDAKGQHFFVGGRWVRDRVLSHAVQEAFRGFQIPGRRPLAYLFVEVPPGSVDVNVHPTKCEVRFLDSGAVHRAAHRAVRRVLEGSSDGGAGRPSGSSGPASSGPEEMRERVRAATLDFLAGPHPERKPVAGGREQGGMAVPSPAGAPVPAPLPPGRVPLQLLESYILLETGEGLVIYDQHALHEKALYERILEGLKKGEMPRQKLLVPEVVDLPLEIAPLLETIARRLEPLGFEVEAFGPRKAAVQSVPAVLGEGPAGPIVLELGRWLLGGGPGGSGDGPEPEGPGPLGAEVRRLAQMVACKRAVKAGMPLHREEIEDLLRSAASARDPRFCPHGRPTMVVISRAELERRFERR